MGRTEISLADPLSNKTLENYLRWHDSQTQPSGRTCGGAWLVISIGLLCLAWIFLARFFYQRRLDCLSIGFEYFTNLTMQQALSKSLPQLLGYLRFFSRSFPTAGRGFLGPGLDLHTPASIGHPLMNFLTSSGSLGERTGTQHRWRTFLRGVARPGSPRTCSPGPLARPSLLPQLFSGRCPRGSGIYKRDGPSKVVANFKEQARLECGLLLSH